MGIGSKYCIAQEKKSCRVKSEYLSGYYDGECRSGLAEGNGEARGKHRYAGIFKRGLPNGEGKYYYSDSAFHIGKFQDGLREGKGEAHFILRSGIDSVVKGFWSGDKYVGKRYVTYKFNGDAQFDRAEVSASPESGTTIRFEITTNSGAPGSQSRKLAYVKGGYILKIKELVSTNKNFTTKISENSTFKKTISLYKQSQFPAKLLCVLSDGKQFQLELYKAADWTIRLHLNK